MQSSNLQRGLQERHIQLIAIGGAIGTGLFLGSAKAIQTTGPSLMISYTIVGFIIYLIMRALGELALYRPVSGSFSVYAEEFIGSWAGYFTGWTYWFMWIVTGMAEITAVGQYVQFWFPEIPPWIPALIALFVVYGINIIAVELFGEVEFWFALIKVATILLLILVGLLIITTGWGNNGQATGISNLWAHGGLFPKGLIGNLLSLQMVMFAFLGVELVGITAGEAKNPEETLPSAIRKIPFRILIFYVGALFVILSIYPWTQLNGQVSPFVLTFAKIGIPAAAGIINFVILTAAWSSCNSGMFSTGRMLYTLAHQRQAPRFLTKLSPNRVPVRALTISSIALLIGVFLNYVIPEKAFTYITSVATVGALWIWGIISYSHLRYRQSGHRNSQFPMPGTPWTNWLVILFLFFVLILMAFDPDTRIALYVGPIWFAFLAISYQWIRHKSTSSN